MKKQTLLASLLGIATVTVITISCNKASTTGLELPLVTPPVKAATPAGFQDSRSLTHVASRTLDTADFKSRFFTSGPTNIFSILTTIDDRITELNTRSLTSTSTCLTATPVEYTITAWGNSVTMYAQCYEVLTGATTADPKLIQWGTKDTKVYLYMAVGAQRVAAIVTPSVASPGDYKVEAYIAVGYTNSSCGSGSWDGCSYGVMQLMADSANSNFEITVAGMGFGFCGAHIKSDGTNVYGQGSTDMASTCNAIDDVCVLASDLVTAGSCTGLTSYDLTSLGRNANTTTGVAQATWAATQFPSSGGNVTLDGTTTDDLNFGPTTPTTGVTAFN